MNEVERFEKLSWSALLEGQNYVDLAPSVFRQLATKRIAAATGPILIPLSELASLRGDETQQFIGEQLGELARWEGLPHELVHREWRAFHLVEVLSEVEAAPHPMTTQSSTLCISCANSIPFGKLAKIRLAFLLNFLTFTPLAI
ncbi:hypothetical protein Dxin01_01099 [Deinococcus xinjiangensis]|uniref:Uncharacterized protein n=1 Tax=Deinococcus xinjiangensis TaxID=457454 RepID=A0ABP9VCE2_9DEIO